ncbi:MAG TPA: molybdopterin cofactor-binding domain-containing protein [Bryobacteraceae bacterium]|nr:molybdopterin cofactor-binding domain-containing protein [Bryobacteraceae bacterium]
MSSVSLVSRRGFLEGVMSAGALILGAPLIPTRLDASEADQAAFHPNVYVGIQPDGQVIIVVHRSEMGTGIRTSLPMILADELDADWKRVRIEQAIGNRKYGSQNTDGSVSIVDFYQPFRQAGATARMMLEGAAAAAWGVPASECQAKNHQVVHAASGRSQGFGELAAAAQQQPVPKKEDLRFKSPADYKYIGKDVPITDLDALVMGQRLFGMDAKVPDMLYASIERPPVLGGKTVKVDDSEALKVRGVSKTVAVEGFKGANYMFNPLGGVAVIADNTWAAFQGRKKLKIDWDLSGPHANYDSTEYKKQLQETARKPGRVERQAGDVDAAFAKAAKVVEAEYYVPHLAHASMEPPVAVADFKDGKVTIWAPVQDPQATQQTVAKLLGVKNEDVVCNVTLLGGGFGRKSKPDFCAEAAILSRELGKPVKVVWSREDDLRFDYFHFVAALYMKAAVDEKGMPVAWLGRSVYPPMLQGSDKPGYGGLGFMGWVDVPFDIPNFRAENGMAQGHVRVGWLRSVANIPHAFAVHSFIDELAAEAGRDRVEYLLAALGPDRIVGARPGARPNPYPLDIARFKRVVQMVADQSGWAKKKSGNGHGWGIAVHRSFLTYVASVVEVEVDNQGHIRIPRVDIVADAGLVVNPERVRSQFEGAAVFGTSLALMGEITAADGRIQQSNFHNYPVARINEAPFETHVSIVKSDAAPAGVGEPGVPPIAPAICNAVFAATGKRIRELPLKKAKLV